MSDASHFEQNLRNGGGGGRGGEGGGGGGKGGKGGGGLAANRGKCRCALAQSFGAQYVQVQSMCVGAERVLWLRALAQSRAYSLAKSAHNAKM
eukprot:1160426-Pelagomonas_calceolata.AAC.8